MMLTVLWDVHGVILLDFLPKGQTINSIKYQKTLKQLSRALRDKCPQMQDVIHYHDNARPHTASATPDAIAEKGWFVLAPSGVQP